MAEFTLALANKAYSSWSLRAWLAVKQTGAPFEEVVIPLRQSDTRTEILKYSPSAKLPALIHGGVTVWESLAIIEYLAEIFPDAGLWPKDAAARAYARAAAHEMHGGFLALRRALPMNMRHDFPGLEIDEAVGAEVNRIQAIWRNTQRHFTGATGEGPYLMGGFSAIDAMYAPVASRFATYAVELESQAQDYVDAVQAHPDMKNWRAAAKKEPWIIAEFERDEAAEED
jgi:glutathione S-transferase